jgi:hypothetical protein
MALEFTKDVDGDYVALSGKIEVGSIIDAVYLTSSNPWLWYFALGYPDSGFSPSLDEAKAIIQAAWDKWLAEAGLIENTETTWNR